MKSWRAVVYQADCFYIHEMLKKQKAAEVVWLQKIKLQKTNQKIKKEINFTSPPSRWFNGESDKTLTNTSCHHKNSH